MNIIKKHISKNYSIGRSVSPKYIVIHETDNTGKGANAMAHYNYWNSNSNAQSSTHFVVDDKQIVQMLNLNERAWHVGDNKGHSNITNSNSIGIEICVNSDGNYSKAYNNCVELVKYLMKTTGLGVNSVKRHYDASGKHCPRRILDNGLWNDFINKVKGKSSNISVSTNTSNNNSNTIQKCKGYVGSRCKELQQKLISLGYSCGSYGADGSFGQGTYNALIKFQKDNNLTVDGLAGKSTFNKLNELINKKNSNINKNNNKSEVKNKMDIEALLKQLYSIECSVNNKIAELDKVKADLMVDLQAIQGIRSYINKNK